MKCTDNQYKKFTIKSLLNSLEEIMARNPQITMDSEVIISDINISFFKQEIKVFPTYDYKDRQMKVGIYLNPYEKDELVDIEESEQVSEQVKEKTKQVNPKNIQAIQEITENLSQVNQEQPQQKIKSSKDMAWLDKYIKV